MIERADGFVAVRGGIGTLSEVTLVWSLLQTRALDGKPLVLLGADWRPVVDCAAVAHRPGRVDRQRWPRSSTPRQQVLSALERTPNTSRPSAPRVTGPGQEGDKRRFPVVQIATGHADLA